MSLGLIVIAGGVVIHALKFPFKAAVFPVTIGISLFLISMVEFCFTLFEKEDGDKDTKGVDSKLSEDADQAFADRRTLSVFLWIFGFFSLIVLSGFPIAVPVFFVFFLRFNGKEKWGISLGQGALAWASFYGLFVRLLHLPFGEGWVQKWLRTIGIG